MSRRDGTFIYHCSVCDGHPEKVARVNSMSLGSAAGSMIQGNEQQLSYPLSGLGASASNSFTSLLSGQISVGSPFQPIQQPKTPLHPIPQSKLSFPGASNSSGIHRFPNYTEPSNMYKFGSNGGADFNSPESDLNLNINNSFRGLMMNAEASAYNIQNSTLPSPHLSKTALLQEDTVTGANLINASVRKSMGSSLSERSLGDGMSGGGGGGGGRGRGSTFEGMYNNLNVGGGSYGSAGGFGGGMEHLSDQMNAPHGGAMYKMNNNVVVEPQMIVPIEYRDKLSKDFHGMGNGTNSLSGGGMVDHHNVNGMGTNLPDSEASTSADPRSFVLGRWPGF
ncbi:hypothetical protein POM88_015370 [Heracleum sosnowskyi]|uniref:Uncharacterized protein n=1 Tax=Heracleum sosnowskyi TaxID=360622 RepID=A0AAD8IMR2_9APIA|nr:hypothetical protein POM88_015370 [Heracleum sosnowskyi]